MARVHTCLRTACVGARSAVFVIAISAYLCFAPSLLAQTFHSQTEANHSWTATSEQENTNLRRTRVVQSHTHNGNQTVDKRSVDIVLDNGNFERYQEIEKETVQVDAGTVRTTTRTYGRNDSGRRTLVQVTEEETHTLPGGDSNIIRITSNPDINGKLQPVQREILATTRIGVDLEETKTSVMLPTVNGMDPVLRADELRKRSANGTVESTKTTLLADGGGSWQLSEIRQRTTSQDNDTRTTEERAFRRDGEQDKLSEVSRVVTKASESSSKEKRETVETYSLDIPGATQNENLHLVERATTAQRTSATGEQISTKQLEKINPGDPASSLRISILINGTLHAVPAGEQATQTISARDSNDSLLVVSVNMAKSDTVATIQFE